MKIGRNITILNEASDNAHAIVDVIGEISENWWTGDGYTKEEVLNAVKAQPLKEITLNISSLGGNFAEALAIKNMLIQTGATIKTKYFGMVASSATIIGSAATKENTTASSDCFILIHNASTELGGNKEDFIKMYESLSKFDESIAMGYVAASGGKRTLEQYAEKMKENVWMSAQEALDWGLVGSLTNAHPITNKVKSENESTIKALGLPPIQNTEKSYTMTEIEKMFTNWATKLGFKNETADAPVIKNYAHESDKGTIYTDTEGIEVNVTKVFSDEAMEVPVEDGVYDIPSVMKKITVTGGVVTEEMEVTNDSPDVAALAAENAALKAEIANEKTAHAATKSEFSNFKKTSESAFNEIKNKVVNLPGDKGAQGFKNDVADNAPKHGFDDVVALRKAEKEKNQTK